MLSFTGSVAYAAPLLAAMQTGSTASRLAEPIRRENLSIFPILSGKTVDTSSFVTLDEGLSTG